MEELVVIKVIKLLNKMFANIKRYDEITFKEKINILKNTIIEEDISLMKDILSVIKDLNISKKDIDYYDEKALNLYSNKRDTNYYKLILILSIENINIEQKDNFIILKYNPFVVYGDLWNEFYMECRGIVIDYKKEQIVTLPYRKFFNLNEKSFISLDLINDYYKKGYKFIIKNKLDGSLINVSKYNGNIIISSSGSFKSPQVIKAKELLEKYSYFLKNLREEYTYIFEVIYPENRIVVDYKDTEDIFLTGIRDKRTLRLVNDDYIKLFAEKFHLKTTEYENKSFEDIQKLLNNYSYKDKEGWVIRIKEVDLLFKLKCADYINIHKYFTFIFNDKNIVNLIREEKIDDFLSKLDGDIKSNLLCKINKINSKVDKVKTDIENLYNSIPSDVLVTRNVLNLIKDFRTEISDKNINKFIINYIIKGRDNNSLSEELKIEYYNKYTMLVNIDKELGRLYNYVNNLKISNVYKKILIEYLSNENINYYNFILEII